MELVLLGSAISGVVVPGSIVLGWVVPGFAQKYRTGGLLFRQRKYVVYSVHSGTQSPVPS